MSYIVNTKSFKKYIYFTCFYNKGTYADKCSCGYCEDNSDDNDSGEDELNNTVNILLGSSRHTHRGFVPRQDTGAGHHTQ